MKKSGKKWMISRGNDSTNNKPGSTFQALAFFDVWIPFLCMIQHSTRFFIVILSPDHLLWSRTCIAYLYKSLFGTLEKRGSVYTLQTYKPFILICTPFHWPTCRSTAFPQILKALKTFAHSISSSSRFSTPLTAFGYLQPSQASLALLSISLLRLWYLSLYWSTMITVLQQHAVLESPHATDYQSSTTLS